MKSKAVVHCLSGFLGKASDWKGVLPEDVPQERYDLFSSGKISQGPLATSIQEKQLGSGLSSDRSLNEWAHELSSQAAQSPSPRVLMGYSLGGRIALHSLIDSPELWSAAVIVSAHPGMDESLVLERQQRIQSDQVWANRFLNEPWESLMASWDAQPVFQIPTTTPAVTRAVTQAVNGTMNRVEREFSREALSGAIKSCSLGLQRDLKPELKRITVPILWISGAHDAKFRAITEKTRSASQFPPQCQVKVIPGAGHRVPWEQPAAFREVILEFLKNSF